MSVLIKGMEMPKDTCEIRITIDQDGDWWARRIDPDDEWHEVVEVPKHGRLIDAGALTELVETEFRNWGEDYDASQFLGDIEDAPTIIEAEE